MSTEKPLRVTITGAAGSIGYAMLFRVASGQMFGPDQPVILQLLELPRAIDALEGVAMELDDCAFPLLHDIVITDDAATAFKDTNLACLIGGRPRGKGMERSDLIEANGPIFTETGKAINDNAADDVRVIVVANPCNTNCLITMHNAPRVPRDRFTAMTRLDQNRAAGQLAKKAGVNPSLVTNMNIWGNHSPTMFPDFLHAEIDGTPATEAVGREWLENEFSKTVRTRGKAIIEARGASSAASAANAAIDHVHDWFNPSGERVSMAICSDGSYGVDEGLICSFPVVVGDDGTPEIVQGLEISDYARKKIDATVDELKGERELVKDLLG